MIKSEYVKNTERIKFQVYEGIRDLGYNVEYEDFEEWLKKLEDNNGFKQAKNPFPSP